MIDANADWNILNPQTVKAIASHVPTTKEELAALGGLGEKILEDYGSRIIRQVNCFVEKENLAEYVKKRPMKRAKQATEAPSKKTGSSLASVEGKQPKQEVVDVDDEDDEFDDCDIDFAAIEY